MKGPRPSDGESSEWQPDLNRVLGFLGYPIDQSTEARETVAPAPEIPRFTIEEKIGEGGMAVVYRARDRELDRIVALKVLHGTADQGEAHHQRFLREARIAARIDHPHTVRLLDAGQHGPWYYLVMELVEGGSFARWIASRTHSIREAIQMLERACQGVAAAHAVGVVHRDLKPQNILVSRAGEPKVADFGLARLDGVAPGAARTVSGYPIGTPLYMAPEQVLGLRDEITPQTDVYAIGAILYESVCGRPPFLADSPAELFGEILRGPLVDPRSIDRRIPRDLQTIILKALERGPSNRYRSILDLAEDLRCFLDGEPVSARPPGLGRRARRWIRRHRIRAAILGVSGLVCCGVLLGLLMQARSDRIAEAARLEEIRREARTSQKELDAAVEEIEEIESGGDEPGPTEKRRIRELAEEAAREQARVVAAYEELLARSPLAEDARRYLFDHYLDSCTRFEREHRTLDAELARLRLEELDPDGTLRAAALGTPRVRIESDPPGAVVIVRRFSTPSLDPWVLDEGRDEGRTPLEIQLSKGSYRVDLLKEGYILAMLPLQVDAKGNDHLADPIHVQLFRESPALRDYVHVCRGWTLVGSLGEWRRIRRVRVRSEFLVSRFEIAWRDYFPYLEECGRTPAWDEEKRPSPFRFEPGGKVGLRGALSEKLPAIFVSLEDARGWCQWFTSNHLDGLGLECRLPTFVEWRLCAGHDGRAHPWGDEFDPDWVTGIQTARSGEKPRPSQVDAETLDRSPIGLLHMAGNVSEWCQTDSSRSGYCGGSWRDDHRSSFRLDRAVRLPQRDYRTESLGFRPVIVRK